MNRLLLLIIFISILFIGCKSGKYVSDFKSIKKNIDTLDILPVNVKIRIINNNKVQGNDLLLEGSITTEITDQIKNILENKYKIVFIDSVVCNSQLYTDLERMRYFIASASNPLKDAEVPPSFNDIKRNLKHKYSLVLIVRSQYYKPNPDQANKSWIDQLTNSYINQYLFLIDNVNNKIIHFKKSNSSGDIHMKSTLEKITLESFQNVYYK